LPGDVVPLPIANEAFRGNRPDVEYARERVDPGCIVFFRWITNTHPSDYNRNIVIPESMMSCEGIWVVEMKGPYGWERIAIAFMKNGEYRGAGPNHYAVGSYKEDGDNFEMSVALTQYGQLRTIFGKKFAGKIQITSKGKIEKNKIIGTSKAKGVKNFDVLIRMTKVDDIE
jgi:hypothetical protein